RMLGGCQVIEAPGGQAAASDQLLRVPCQPGPTYQSLEIGHPSADRLPRTPAAVLEREEPYRRVVLLQNSHPHVGANRGHRLRVLRTEKRAMQSRVRTLPARPRQHVIVRQSIDG